MTKLPRILAMLLLCHLAAMAAWAASPERGRKDVPVGVDEHGVVLDVVGVFEAKELEGKFITLYQDPLKGNLGYLAVEGPTSGEDQLKVGDVELVVTLDSNGEPKSVEACVDGTCGNVPTLKPEEIKKSERPLPDFDDVPPDLPCNPATYQDSQWSLGCLVDFFLCAGSPIPVGTIACCDGGVSPFGTPIADCQKDFGVPLATATN